MVYRISVSCLQVCTYLHGLEYANYAVAVCNALYISCRVQFSPDKSESLQNIMHSFTKQINEICLKYADTLYRFLGNGLHRSEEQIYTIIKTLSKF